MSTLSEQSPADVELLGALVYNLFVIASRLDLLPREHPIPSLERFMQGMSLPVGIDWPQDLTERLRRRAQELVRARYAAQ